MHFRLQETKIKGQKNSGIIPLTEVLVFVTAITFFQLNLVFIADSRTGFRSGLLSKYELNVRSSHWRCPVKKGVLKNIANLTGTSVLSLQGCNFIKKCPQHSCVPVEFEKFLRTPVLKNICERLLLKPVQVSPGLHFFDNLHFRLKLVHMLQFLYHN